MINCNKYSALAGYSLTGKRQFGYALANTGNQSNGMIMCKKVNTD